MTRELLALMTVAIPPLLFGLRTGAYASGALVILCLIRAVVLVVARRIEKERRLRWIDEKLRQAERETPPATKTQQ